MDPSSGVVTVAPCETPGRGNCLDFEARPAYFLSYQATDDRGRGQSAVVPLTVRLTDANDNPPAFEQRVYTALIDEGDAHFDPPLRVQVGSRLHRARAVAEGTTETKTGGATLGP